MIHDTRVLRAHYRDGLSCSQIDRAFDLSFGTARRMISASWVDDFARTKQAYKWREWRRFNDIE